MDLKHGALLANVLPVAGATTVWTNTFKMAHAKNFAVEVVCATSTSPSIRIQLECSIQLLSFGGGTNFNQEATSIYYVVPENFGDIFTNIVDTNYHYKGYQPPYSIHGRFKITGLSGNPSDTTITIWNIMQDLGRTFGG